MMLMGMVPLNLDEEREENYRQMGAALGAMNDYSRDHSLHSFDGIIMINPDACIHDHNQCVFRDALGDVVKQPALVFWNCGLPAGV